MVWHRKYGFKMSSFPSELHSHFIASTLYVQAQRTLYSEEKNCGQKEELAIS